jgi:hypothetical protein
MKQWGALVLAACALVAGCDDSPTAPSNSPLVFTAVLSPANEVPAIANAESTGRGAVQITTTVTRDSTNAVTGGTATFHFQLSGFPGTTSVVGAHIHNGPAGVNAPIVVNTNVSATSPVVLDNGTGSFTVSGIVVDATTMQSIINSPAGFYFNVHSPLNPGGFARGQLVRTN